MDIKTKKINDFQVSKIRLPVVADKKIRGGELLPLYSNVFICAKKNSGKTTTIFNILKKCADRDTKLYFFVSTIEKDRSWMAILNYFFNRGNPIISNTSTVSDNGVDLIQDILDEENDFSDSSESSSSSSEVDFIKVDSRINIDVEEEQKKKEKKRKKKKRKKNKIAQKRIIVLDDIGNELKRPVIDQLVKVNRHLHSKVLISSQYLNDLSPQSRRQIDIWMLFNGCKKEKLKTIMRDCDTDMDYENFEQLYKYATAQKYNFFYIDCHKNKFRKNFNEEISI